jgi:hypothetical protein
VSERKIRNFAWHHPWCKGIKTGYFEGCDCGYREARRADPDAVRILWRIEEVAKDDIVVATVKDKLADVIFDETGYRLVDEPPGWEWTEEDE